jgi:hypothetical protein
MSAARDRWMDRLARFESSGQTIKAFCATEGVSQVSFYSWKRKLATESQSPQVLAAPLPICLTPAALLPRIVEIVLVTGVTLRWPVDFPPSQLAGLVHALEAPSC